MDEPHEVITHYLRVFAWWENPLIVLGLVGSLFAAAIGIVWFRNRRRKLPTKAPGKPVPIAATKALPDRVATGYGDLDNILFGGIPKDYAVILTAPSSDERDFLVRRFLETGATNDEVTFYITTDPGELKSLVEAHRSNFHLFICNPQADKIIESLSNVTKIKGVENLTEINIALTKGFRGVDESITGPKRACIEILSAVLLQHHAVQTRRWLTDLLTELKASGFTTLAVLNPKMHPSEEVHAILDLFEGEINIYERAREEKFLKIKKLYNQKYLESELPLKKDRLEE
jgi:KaiC/GvpD/RAD55 family RecA-like ATPase